MSEATPKPSGRLRAAWQVLMGRRMVPFQIQAEWIEYKVTFDDIFSKMSAALARQSKLRKAQIDASLESPQMDLPLSMSGRKAEVRRKAAERHLQIARTPSRQQVANGATTIDPRDLEEAP